MKKFKEIAKKAFDKNKEVSEVLVTEDGHAFFSKNAANLHATTSKGNKKLKVYTFSATELSQDKSAEKNDNKELTGAQKAKAKVKEIKTLETVEAVDKAIEGQTAPSVIKAGNERKAELVKLNTADSPEGRNESEKQAE